jgi:hypothetical protein
MANDNHEDLSKDRTTARALIRSVVLAQGNIFIRELLRRKRIPIGVRKQDFEANLLQAINSGDLRLADILEWLEEVEGWGDQHVYLYHLPDALAGQPLWNSAETVKQRLPSSHRKLWDADSLVFPEEWSLTGISYSDGSLRYVWHQRLTTLLRRPKMDRRERVEGDWYQFRAFLERPDRSVMRFVLHPGKRLAAIFMQIPAEGEAHENARSMVREATKSLIEWKQLEEFSASDAIKNLDQSALESEATSKVKSRKTRLTDADNYIEFATTSEEGGFLQSQAIRSVRRAVKPEEFAGNVGIFLYEGRTPTQQKRTVKIEIFGEQRRIKLWAQLKASEVWEILELLRSYEQWPAKTQTGPLSEKSIQPS